MSENQLPENEKNLSAKNTSKEAETNGSVYEKLNTPSNPEPTEPLFNIEEEESPFEAGGDFQLKPSRFEKFCLFPLRLFPFLDGVAVGIFGVFVQILWSLLLIALGLAIALLSLCLGCIVIAQLGQIH